MGALDAVISWSTDGIKETVRDAIPFLGSLVSRVTTNRPTAPSSWRVRWQRHRRRRSPTAGWNFRCSS